MEIDFNKMKSIILDETENMIYISEPETYRIVYMNKVAREKFGITGESWKGQPCYKILQNRDEPCPFCNSHILTKDKFYEWKHYNSVLGQYYRLHDKLIEVDNQMLRLEICTDVTETVTETKLLEQQLSVEETLVKCIHTLSDTMDMTKAIRKLLCIIGEFYGADRCYIFEFDNRRQAITNTYEWCKEGVRSEKDHLRCLPMSMAAPWLRQFREKGEFYISHITEAVDRDSREYQLLSKQGIEAMMAAPLMSGNEYTGLIGVDNPVRGVEQVRLLKNISCFIQNDISKRKLMERFREQGRTDALTGIGNRNLYIEMMEQLKTQRIDSLGVVFIDINGLKKANDNYGHDYGDSMIRNVARGLQMAFPDYAYRIGGDEFVALYVNGSKEEFERRIHMLLEYKKRDCICDFSMGYNFNDSDVDVIAQIGYSDFMMYTEKQQFYSSTAGFKGAYHEAFGKKVRREIGQGAFQVYLQPQIDLDSGLLYGAEALVRKNSGGKVIFPGEFISLYEAERVIQYLDLFVFEEVCRMLNSWRYAGYGCVPISVNFSRISLMGPDIVKRLAAIREQYQIDADLLAIEVTESISRINSHILCQLIKDFTENDFRLVLDDFGSQYSNLAIFTNMNFAELKLDRSLIQNIEKSPKACVVVEHMIAMCKSLEGTVCIAEGIETESQLELLKKYSCDVGQGFLFSKPVPEKEFLEKYQDKMKENLE